MERENGKQQSFRRRRGRRNDEKVGRERQREAEEERLKEKGMRWLEIERQKD